MTNNYTFLSTINENTIAEMIRRGMLPLSIMTKKTVYEAYLQEAKGNDKQSAITYVADKYELHERTIYKIIKFMNT